jgi:chaperonin GroEL (HSP60 family)
LIDFIRVGGTTEVEVKEKKDCVADATQPGRPLKRASFPGGGIGPLLASPSLGQSEA